MTSSNADLQNWVRRIPPNRSQGSDWQVRIAWVRMTDMVSMLDDHPTWLHGHPSCSSVNFGSTVVGTWWTAGQCTCRPRDTNLVLLSSQGPHLKLCFGGLSDTQVVVTVQMEGFYSRLATVRSVRKTYTWLLLVNNLELFPYVRILLPFFFFGLHIMHTLFCELSMSTSSQEALCNVGQILKNRLLDLLKFKL